MADVDIDVVVAQIDMGRHDGNLNGIFDAVRRRMGENLVEFVWRISIDDVSFGVGDMSLMALEAAEVACERSWQVFNPETSAVEYKSLLVCHLSHDMGWDDERIDKRVRSLTMDKMVDSITWAEVSPSPKDTSGH